LKRIPVKNKVRNYPYAVPLNIFLKIMDGVGNFRPAEFSELNNFVNDSCR
jgi:hypothetical protein